MASARRFPIRVFIGAVVVVCLALAVSALLGFRSMIELRDLYLEDRARDVSEMLAERLRGPDRLDPEAWHQLMDEVLQSGTMPGLKYLALLDKNRKVLTASGAMSNDMHLHEAEVRTPRWGRQGGRFGRPGAGPGLGPGPGSAAGTEQPGTLSLRIGIERSGAWFIARQAYIHLAVSAVAILTLSLLAFFFFRTLRGFLELQRQEESQRNLASLGRLSATLAHEIRNPLGAIKGLTQVAQERLPQDHDTQELMTTVVGEAERLERLVTDLLTFARPREMRSVEVELKKLLGDVVEGLRPQATDKNVSFELPDAESGTSVWADPDGLKQVFLNVLLNSIEAAPPGSRVSVTIQPSEPNVLVEISDEGPGIGDLNPEELFQPFVTTKTRGTGLGLPVTRQIVERLGGMVELRNREPKGATCRLALPARKPASSESRAIATGVGG